MPRDYFGTPQESPLHIAGNVTAALLDARSQEHTEFALACGVASALDPKDEEVKHLRAQLEAANAERHADTEKMTAEIKRLADLLEKHLRPWHEKLGEKFSKIWTAIKSTAKDIWKGKKDAEGKRQGGLKAFLGVVGGKVSALFKEVKEYVGKKLEKVGDFCAVVADQVEYVAKVAEAHVTREVETLGFQAVSGMVRAALGSSAKVALPEDRKTPKQKFEEAIAAAEKGHKYDSKKFVDPYFTRPSLSPEEEKLNRRIALAETPEKYVRKAGELLNKVGTKIETSLTKVPVIGRAFKKKDQSKGTAPGQW